MDLHQMSLGCDVSHYQGMVDWPTLAATGIRFVLIKATQGTWTDSAFERNRKGATDAGLLVFAYPFLTPYDNDEVVGEFLRVTDGLVPALDWEESGTPDAVIERWIDGYETKAGREGLAYYGLYPPDALTSKIAKWPRWLPEYATVPKLPAWDGTNPADWTAEWLIWQFTANGREPGIEAAVDLDRLAIPLTQLGKWYATGKFT